MLDKNQIDNLSQREKRLFFLGYCRNHLNRYGTGGFSQLPLYNEREYKKINDFLNTPHNKRNYEKFYDKDDEFSKEIIMSDENAPYEIKNKIILDSKSGITNYIMKKYLEIELTQKDLEYLFNNHLNELQLALSSMISSNRETMYSFDSDVRAKSYNTNIAEKNIKPLCDLFMRRKTVRAKFCCTPFRYIKDEELAKYYLNHPKCDESVRVAIATNPFLPDGVRNEAFNGGIDTNGIQFYSLTEDIAKEIYSSAITTYMESGYSPQNPPLKGNEDKKGYNDACSALHYLFSYYPLPESIYIDFFNRMVSIGLTNANNPLGYVISKTKSDYILENIESVKNKDNFAHIFYNKNFETKDLEEILLSAIIVKTKVIRKPKKYPNYIHDYIRILTSSRTLSEVTYNEILSRVENSASDIVNSPYTPISVLQKIQKMYEPDMKHYMNTYPHDKSDEYNTPQYFYTVAKFAEFFKKISSTKEYNDYYANYIKYSISTASANAYKFGYDNDIIYNDGNHFGKYSFSDSVFSDAFAPYRKETLSKIHEKANGEDEVDKFLFSYLEKEMNRCEEKYNLLNSPYGKMEKIYSDFVSGLSGSSHEQKLFTEIDDAANKFADAYKNLLDIGPRYSPPVLEYMEKYTDLLISTTYYYSAKANPITFLASAEDEFEKKEKNEFKEEER